MARGRLVVAVLLPTHSICNMARPTHTASQATQSSEGHILACILFTPRHLDLLLIKNDKPPNGCLPFPRSTGRHTRTVVYTQRDDAPSQQPPFNAHVASYCPDCETRGRYRVRLEPAAWRELSLPPTEAEQFEATNCLVAQFRVRTLQSFTYEQSGQPRP